MPLALKVISLWSLLQIKRHVFNNRMDPVLGWKMGSLLGNAYTTPIFKIQAFIQYLLGFSMSGLMGEMKIINT